MRGLEFKSTGTQLCTALPTFAGALTGKALPSGYELFVTVNVAWIFNVPKLLTILTGDDTGGTGRCGLYLISFSIRAHCDIIVQPRHFFEASFQSEVRHLRVCSFCAYSVNDKTLDFLKQYCVLLQHPVHKAMSLFRCV